MRLTSQIARIVLPAASIAALATAALVLSASARADGSPAAHAIAHKFAVQAPASPVRKAGASDADRRTWESEMLARARAEAEARRRDAEVLRDAEEAARDRAADAERAARRIEDDARTIDEAEAATVLPERYPTADARDDEDDGVAASDYDAKSGLPIRPPVPVVVQPRDRQAGRFAILLRMEPGHRGIRRRNPTADPVVCVDDNCYVSNGAEATASLMRNRRALGFLRTWSGKRAGACNHSLGCVFRDVELGPDAVWIQPVDMRLVRHDRREAQRIDAASDCSVTRGRLTCARPIRSHDYVMWIVPESLAQLVGPTGLLRAVETGLGEHDSAHAR